MSLRLLSRVREALIRSSLRRAAKQLANANAESLQAGTPTRVLSIFQSAASSVPAYRRLLEQRGISAPKIQSLDSFHRLVPVIDKRSWFSNELHDICRRGTLDEVASFYSSSGQTGVFSFGVESREDQGNGALSVEFALQQAFGALDCKTLLINCLPMGVRLHTRSLPVVETSVREDVIFSLLRKLKGKFDQFILIGEHPFLKHLIEEAMDGPNALDWRNLRVHIVTGAEYVAENFRSYLSSLLGSDITNPDSGRIVVNYGLSELSVSIAQENWHTIQIRRLAYEKPAFREALCGGDVSFCPNVMQYYPSQVYLEAHPSMNGWDEIVVTMLDEKRQIPMVRYNTGDRGSLMSHDELSQILRSFNHPEMIPPLRLPVALMWGKCQGLTTDAVTVYPEQVKEALYGVQDVATCVTGNFRLRQGPSHPEVLIQLKEKKTSSAEIFSRLCEQLARYTRATVHPRMVPYAEFPFGMRHDFERKNRYFDPENGGAMENGIRNPQQ